MSKLQKLSTTLFAILAVSLPAAAAFAQEHAAGAGRSDGWAIALGLCIGIGIAAFGGALGQSRTAAAALEGIARNPNASDKVFVPMILGLAFIESLVLFTWVLMLLMQLKL